MIPPPSMDVLAWDSTGSSEAPTRRDLFRPDKAKQKRAHPCRRGVRHGGRGDLGGGQEGVGGGQGQAGGSEAEAPDQAGTAAFGRKMNESACDKGGADPDPETDSEQSDEETMSSSREADSNGSNAGKQLTLRQMAVRGLRARKIEKSTKKKLMAMTGKLCSVLITCAAAVGAMAEEVFAEPLHDLSRKPSKSSFL